MKRGHRYLLATLPIVACLAIAASTQGASPKLLYRITGCVSRGSSAYTSGPSRHEVAIGFDDGPARDTSAFVTMLERSHTRATFFMIGEQVNASYRATLLRELRD